MKKIRCNVVCIVKKEGKIIGMKIKCFDENEVYYTIEEIYKLQTPLKEVMSHLPQETHGETLDIFIPTIHKGSTLMSIEKVDGVLQIVNPNMDKINVAECTS